MGYMISACLKYYELREVLFFFSSILLIDHHFRFLVYKYGKPGPSVSVSSERVIFQSGFVKFVARLTSPGSVVITTGISSIRG